MCWTVNEIKKGVWHVDESGLDAMYVVCLLYTSRLLFFYVIGNYSVMFLL